VVKRPWLNGETTLWHLSGETKTWLSACGVLDVSWGETVRECAYCGSEIAALKCQNCGASKGRTAYRSNAAKMVVEGYLQQAGLLTAVGTKDVLEVHHAHCGRRDDYGNGAVIMRFSELSIQGIDLVDMVVYDPMKRDILCMSLTLGCTGELFLEEGDWVF